MGVVRSKQITEENGVMTFPSRRHQVVQVPYLQGEKEKLLGITQTNNNNYRKLKLIANIVKTIIKPLTLKLMQEVPTPSVARFGSVIMNDYTTCTSVREGWEYMALG